MSELKAYIYDDMIDGDADTNIEYYPKSEADKVIAEKDEEIDELKESIDQLQKATDSAWSKVNTMYDELRHQKFKRCLAMARWCETQFAYYLASCDRYDSEYVNKKVGHFYKWKYKWLELAEKFKEAK